MNSRPSIHNQARHPIQRYSSADFGYISDREDVHEESHLNIDRLVRPGELIDERDVAVINSHDDATVMLSLYERAEQDTLETLPRARYSYAQRRDTRHFPQNHALAETAVLPQSTELSFVADFAQFVYVQYVIRPYETIKELLQQDVLLDHFHTFSTNARTFLYSLQEGVTLLLQHTDQAKPQEPVTPIVEAGPKRAEDADQRPADNEVTYQYVLAPAASAEEIIAEIQDFGQMPTKQPDPEEGERDTDTAVAAEADRLPLVARTDFIRTGTSQLPTSPEPLITPSRPPLDLIALMRESLRVLTHPFRSRGHSTVSPTSKPAITYTPTRSPAPTRQYTPTAPTRAHVAPVVPSHNDRRFPTPRAGSPIPVAHARTAVPAPVTHTSQALIPRTQFQPIPAPIYSPPAPARNKRSRTKRFLLAIAYVDHLALLKLAFKVWIGITVTGIVLQTLGVLSF